MKPMTSAPSALAAPDVTHRLKALGLILVTFFFFACLDTTAKYLGEVLSPVQIVWMRFFTHFLLAMAIFRPWRAWSFYLPRKWPLQVLRGLLLLATTMLNFLAVQRLQLTETAAIFFLAPFIVTALAGPFLGEWAGPRRWAAIVIGFAGALLIIKPVPGAFQPALLISIAATTCYAGYVLLTRRLAGKETAESMIILPAVIAGFVMLPPGLSFWKEVPDTFHWFLLLITGLLGGLGHWFLIKAHELAPAPVLAPFVYTQLLWMTALGFLVFGDVPPVSTALGAAVIIVSGLYLLYRERRVSDVVKLDQGI
ncbi:DMT family transporter [Afifella sp. IM 167]|uniref:DMT family transporter n=1 Tax=Afifella sp. IM 167 TaxID=2033586 RepID=UPI001CCA715F|nr:DMT family transporter [Afifella sp. IM 167]MBZ8132676.1 EamA family transporter [Afifella sp. IM 167]